MEILARTAESYSSPGGRLQSEAGNFVKRGLPRGARGCRARPDSFRMQHLLKECFTILHRNDSSELQPPGSPPRLPKPSSVVAEDVQTDRDCSLA